MSVPIWIGVIYLTGMILMLIAMKYVIPRHMYTQVKWGFEYKDGRDKEVLDWGAVIILLFFWWLGLFVLPILGISWVLKKLFQEVISNWLGEDYE